MGFAQALNEQVKKAGTRCTIALVLEAMNPDDAAALAAALGDPVWLNAQIHRALKAEGNEIGLSSISRHRRGDCACGAS